MEYTLVTAKRYNDVIEHLKHNFFADEPLNKAVGLCRRGMGHTDLERHSLETLQDNLSLMALNENNEVVGACLNGIFLPGDLECGLKNLHCDDDEKFKKIMKFLYTTNLKVDLFQQFDIDRVFDTRILSVDQNYRGQGIAKNLLQHSEELARADGFQLMKADATSIFSQKIAKSVGYQVYIEQYYDRYLDEYNRPVFPVESPHIKMQSLFKLLD